MAVLGALLLAAIAVLCFFLAVQLINLFALKKLGRFPHCGANPFVSVLVPARNEAGNIADCVRSLLEQDYPSFEVIVLDDESEDATWEILCRLARRVERLRLLKGLPLPAGWVGKCWACHQLAEQARGDYFLFVDADTRHKPGMLRAAVDAAFFYGTDLLTAMPGERAETLSETLAIPLVTWGTFAALPLPLAFALPSPTLTITIGQFLLFRRGAYEQIGGHAAVAGQVVEDMELGKLVKSQGFRWRLLDGGAVVRCRMYTNFRAAVNGLSKTIFGALNYRALPVFFFSLLLALIFCLPPLTLLAAAAGVGLPKLPVFRAAAAVLLALLSWGIANVRFRMPWYATFLYPAIAGITIFIFFHSMILTLKGKARWKGRVLSGRKFRW
jgi:chlorobactene glucosyltransferase